MKPKLTQKQEKAVLHYFEYGNKTQAFKHAFDTSKMTSKSINERACRLFVEVKISTRLQELRDGLQERAGITLERVVKEIAKIAFGDIKELYNEDGKLLQPHELDDNTAAQISSFKSRMELSGKDNEDVALIEEYKRHDKVKALDMLTRHLGGYVDRVEHSGQIVKRVINVNPSKKKK